METLPGPVYGSEGQVHQCTKDSGPLPLLLVPIRPLPIPKALSGTLGPASSFRGAPLFLSVSPSEKTERWMTNSQSMYAR